VSLVNFVVKSHPRIDKCRGDLMRATVDPNRCDIAGICVKICPEVFRFHEGSKKAYVTRKEIPKNLEQKCLEAAKKCPHKAIIILTD